MKRNTKKLSLAKQTVRLLDTHDLGAVNGGGTTIYSCIPIITVGCNYPVPPLPPSMMSSLNTTC